MLTENIYLDLLITVTKLYFKETFILRCPIRQTCLIFYNKFNK